MVTTFNATNSQFEIVPTYFDDGFDSSTMTLNPDAMSKFNTEVITGKTPDIIATYASFPIDNYIRKEFLSDLYTLLDADSELGGRDAILSDIRRVSEYDGKLYQLSPYFVLNVVAGNSESLQNKSAWTQEEALTLFTKLKTPGSVIVSQMSAFTALENSLYDFVDYKNAVCNFDKPEFIALLNYAKTFPMEITPSLDYFGAVKNGTALAGNNVLFSNFQSHLAAKKQLGSDIIYIGFPGNNANYIGLPYGLSITSACKNKAAAWEFVRGFITDNGGEDFTAFPTNSKTFERMAKLATELENNAAAESDIDAVKAVISKAVKHTNDFRLNAIIRDDSAPFFAGEKTAEDTARIIQSRVSIYLAEQR
jgi:hypothetical protein